MRNLLFIVSNEREYLGGCTHPMNLMIPICSMICPLKLCPLYPHHHALVTRLAGGDESPGVRRPPLAVIA